MTNHWPLYLSVFSSTFLLPFTLSQCNCKGHQRDLPLPDEGTELHLDSFFVTLVIDTCILLFTLDPTNPTGVVLKCCTGNLTASYFSPRLL